MNIKKTIRATVFFFGLTFGAQIAPAVTFDLDCILGANTCAPIGASLGTVSIADIPGGVNVVVDTMFRLKFRDLFFNLNTPPGMVDSPAVYAADGFSLALYNGRFDVGRDVGLNQGFFGLDGSSFQILGAGINAANFVSLDTLNFVSIAAHLFDRDECGCDTHFFVGGRFVPPGDDPGVPEPATIAITGLGLAAVLAFTRRRTV